MDLRITARPSLHDSEADDALTKYRVDLLAQNQGGDDVGELGYFNVHHFIVTSCAFWEAFDVFDSISQETHDIFSDLYDQENEYWRGDLGELGLGSDILYFESADLAKQLKSSHLTLAAVERIIQLLGGGCALAVMWPTDDSLINDAEFWAQIGFHRVDTTPILARALGMKSPTVSDLLKDHWG